MINVYTDSQLAKMDEKRASKLRYKMNGSPDPDSGVRVLSPEEIFELCLDPKFQRCVEIAETAEGHEKAVRGVVKSACKAIRHYDMQAEEQIRVIKMAEKKALGV